ncbi:MAG TPA: type II secretion system protein [Acidothermaceae bacterium]
MKTPLARHRHALRVVSSKLESTDARSDGFTLIELLVSMVIFAMLLSVMMSVVIAMNKDLNKTTSIVDASSQGLRATQAIDKQLRYADSVNTEALGASGDRYVSFEGLTDTGVSECYQWRVHSGGFLQQRTWQAGTTEPANTAAVTATSPAWQTVAVGVVNPTSSPPFTVTTVGGSGGASTVFRQVVVDLVLQGKSSSVGHAETKLTITARNSNYPPGGGSTPCKAVTP